MAALDEVALHSPTQVAELRDGEITGYQLTPEENRDIVARLLQSKGQPAHEQAVAVNIAMLLKVFGNEDLRDNAQRAITAIRSGQAYERVVALAARG